MRTIIADDDKTLLLLHKTFIKRSGICESPHLCADGKETIDLIENFESVEPILLFLDINMPKIDGWGVLDYIQTLKTSSHIHVIVVTSSVRTEDRIKANSYAHVKQFVIKPINTTTLNSIKSMDFFRN